MVNISQKAETERKAVAKGEVHLSQGTVDMITGHLAKKGDVFTVAQLAGIMGAKKTAEIIPLCHPILITHVDVNLEIAQDFIGV